MAIFNLFTAKTNKQLTYYGTATNLYSARDDLAATTVGDYAIFYGGVGSSSNSAIDAYNSSLTQSLSKAVGLKRVLAATTVANYAIFAGGYGVQGSEQDSCVIYDNSLTQYTTAVSLSQARHALAGGTLNNLAYFGGGNIGSGVVSRVDTLDTSLTRNIVASLTTGRDYLSAATVGNYILFGAGSNGSNNAAQGRDIYDIAGTHYTTPTFNDSYNGAATSIDEYAIFGSSYYTTAIDSSLTRTTLDAFERRYLTGAAIENYALFGGGSHKSSLTQESIVDVYDSNLTHNLTTSLSVGRYKLAATTVGNYVLFGGGYSSNGNTAVVDVYTI